MNKQLQKVFLMIESLGEEIGMEELRKLEADGKWRTLGSSITTETYLRKFITQDPDMITLKDDTRKCASVDWPVLIQGETGTGKELIARALHGGRNGPFKAINVTNLPSELLESELFGHVRGAFTGADRDKPGLFQVAGDGTIFLDEIGDMPLDMQCKLLRAVEDRKARRLGSNEEFEIKCRIVSATNQKIETGEKFRGDLYYRLAVLVLRTKPLRDRLGDVKLIVDSIDPKFPAEFVWYKERDATRKDGFIIPAHSEINNLSGNVRSIQAIIRRWQVLGRTEE